MGSSLRANFISSSFRGGRSRGGRRSEKLKEGQGRSREDGGGQRIGMTYDFFSLWYANIPF
jgi:hypothetical protein